MSYKFKVQESKKIRVIIDTDTTCEADDQYAIVHALLTPKFIIKGIIGEQFNSQGVENSVDRSVDEINHLLNIMEITDIPVLRGYSGALASDNDIPNSDGADFIIREALS